MYCPSSRLIWIFQFGRRIEKPLRLIVIILYIRVYKANIIYVHEHNTVTSSLALWAILLLLEVRGGITNFEVLALFFVEDFYKDH